MSKAYLSLLCILLPESHKRMRKRIASGDFLKSNTLRKNSRFLISPDPSMQAVPREVFSPEIFNISRPFIA